MPPPPPSGPRIQLSQGGSAPSGYWYSVVLTQFTPNSSVTLNCNDSVDSGFFTEVVSVGPSGSYVDTTLCFSGDGPLHWVNAGTVLSNVVAW
jgi:hypothetical protein